MRTEKTLNGSVEDTPPPGWGFDTEIAAQLSCVRSACGTVAVSSVLLLKVVGRAAPFSSTVEPLMKFAPASVIVVSPDPLTIPAGEMAERVGATLNSLPVMLRVDVA